MTPRSRGSTPKGDDSLASSHTWHATFEGFYRDRYHAVAKALAFTLGDTDFGVEAADEAMARAYSRWPTIKSYENPSAWVYRVGLNWARSLHRRIAKRWPFREREAVNAPPIADPKIERALKDLHVDLRAVVVCRLLLDWSVETTASALGLAPGTVKSRQHRALKQLEQRLHHMRNHHG